MNTWTRVLLLVLAVLAVAVDWNENGRRGRQPSRPATSTCEVNVNKKVSKRGGARNKTTRAPRFDTPAELRKAVIEWCVDQAGILFGDPALAAGLKESIKATIDVDPYPREVWRALAGALAEAFDLWKDFKQGQFQDSIYAQRVEMMFRNSPFTACAAFMWRSALEVDSDIRMPPEMQPRARVVALFDAPGKLWWGDRRPTAKELAILSLLAGEFPEGQRRQQVEARKSGVPLALPTVMDVVRAETRAVSNARARIEQERREYASRPHYTLMRSRGAWLRRV